MKQKDSSLLFVHSYDSFSKKNISLTAEKYGFSRKDVLESHMWVYELYSHIQKYAGTHCILKGGACAQLYLPLNEQRCTVDIDAVTDLSPDELEEMLRSIKYNFNMKKFYCSFREYVPSFINVSKRIPMKTFFFYLPFIFKKGKKKEPPSLKIDFLFYDTSKLDKSIISKGETIGLKLNYSPICISPHSLICDKLLTFAVNSIGLELSKVDGFYKNIYDLFYLVNRYNTLEDFKIISDNIKYSINAEFEIKKIPPIDVNILLDDIMDTFYRICIFDLRENYKPHKKLVKFQESFLQEEIKEYIDSDVWAIMSMYLYLWTLSLNEYIEKKDYTSLNFVENIIETFHYYQSLNSKDSHDFIKRLKNNIIKKDTRLNLSTIHEPLRLIYLNQILQIY